MALRNNRYSLVILRYRSTFSAASWKEVHLYYNLLKEQKTFLLKRSEEATLLHKKRRFNSCREILTQTYRLDRWFSRAVLSPLPEFASNSSTSDSFSLLLPLQYQSATEERVGWNTGNIVEFAVKYHESLAVCRNETKQGILMSQLYSFIKKLVNIYLV